MIADLPWIYAFNLIINSLLTFLTLALAIRILLFVCKIQNARLKAMLLCIPLIKLLCDPFLYNFQNWALTHQINPIEAETGSRMMSMSLLLPDLSNWIPFTSAIGFSLQNGRTFTLADIAALSTPPLLIKGFILSTGLVSLSLFSFFLSNLWSSYRYLSSVKKDAAPYHRALQNQQLSQKMKKANAILMTSPSIAVPCAFGIFQKVICFPITLVDALTQEEFEAIVAHELGHLRWYDSVVRGVCHCARAVFWWVPTGFWTNYMEQTQEIACDSTIHTYHIEQADLASAIVKAAKEAKGANPLFLATAFVQEKSIISRILALSGGPSKAKGRFVWLQSILIAIFMGSIFLGRFWIF